MNTVNKDMRDAEKNLAGLEKCCGLCACPWQKVNLLFIKYWRSICNALFAQGKAPQKNEEYKKIWKKNQDGKVVSAQPMNVADDRNAVRIHFYTSSLVERKGRPFVLSSFLANQWDPFLHKRSVIDSIWDFGQMNVACFQWDICLKRNVLNFRGFCLTQN